MSSIAAGTTTTTGYVVTSDSTGALVLKTGASATTAVTIGSDQSVTFAGSQTFSGGTANGVLYLNGSKAVTSGSALVFDGTNFFGGTNIYASGRFYAQRSSSSLNLPIAGYTDGSAGAVLSGTKGDIVAFGNAGGDGVIFANANTEQMRLTSTGLGIGTSSPAAKLDVTGNGLVSSFGSSSTAETYVQVRNGTSTLYLGGKSDQNYVYGTAAIPLTFWTNSTERMRLDSSGKLGLGMTPSGSYSLQIYGVGASAGSARIRLNNSSTGTADADGGGIAMEGVDLVIQNSENGVCKWEINGSERARIDASGNFLVGGTIASGKLTVTTSETKGQNATPFVITTSDANNRFELIFARSTNTAYRIQAVEQGVAYRDIVMQSDGGRLLVGTTTAYDSLTVQGGIRGFSNGTLGGVVVADSGGTAQNFARMTSNGSDIAWGQNIVTYPGTWTKSVTGAVSGGWVIGADASCAYYTSAAGNASPLQNVRLFIDSTGKLFSLPTYNNTTGAAANMGVDSTAGVFYRSTSSLKYKRDVRDYDKGLETLMTLRSVYYKGTSERDGDTQYAGLIAEEVHDAGLPEFVQYAEDGTPDALAYGHMVSLLTKAIQEQQAIIQQLQADVAALKGTA